MIEKKYYVRYLPSEEEGTIDSLYFFKINDKWGTPADFDSLIGAPIQEVKLAKLFICTKDFNVGDTVMCEDFHEWMVKDKSDPHNIYCIDDKGGSSLTCMVSDCPYRNPEEDLFKVIGPLPENVDIQNGDEFDSEVVRVLVKNLTED